MPNEFVSDFVRVPDEERAPGPELRIEVTARHRGPSPFLADIAHDLRPAGEVYVGGFLRRLGHETRRMHADDQSLWRVPRTPARLAVEIDERPEAPRFAADDRHHQGQSERTGAGE